jgi:hypothetical protein
METELVNIENSPAEEAGKEVSKATRRLIEWILILILLLGYVVVSFSQSNLDTIRFKALSTFNPTIKDAIKLNDLPEIKDSVKRIKDINYGITSKPIFPKYQVQEISSAKMKNEPLPKLYHSLLKAGYSPFYNMPYGEFWIANTRDREKSFGAHVKHLSSTTHLENVGYGGFSDNAANVFGKQFYKKHTLSGEFNYERNVVHYYGYDTSVNKVSDDFTKQRYQLFEPKIRLLSHYTDSTHINHDIRASYYNLQNLNRESENNFRVNALGSMFLNKEKFNLDFLTDYYNHKQSNDTLNDVIVTLHPSFEAHGKKWHADIGLAGTLDNFRGKAKFYPYPRINVYYDIYEHMVIPYAGLDGGLIKNSFRSLSRENPFIDTVVNFANTNNRVNAFGGLKGNLSSHTSYDVKTAYSVYEHMYFYVLNYSSPVQMHNMFDLVYDTATLLTLSGQIKYTMKEKLNLYAKGNYYKWTTKHLQRAYMKPDFDVTFTGVYNLQSKIILRADLFFMGQQWSYSPITDSNNQLSYGPKQIKGWADINLEAEYRYSKMLSFFVRFNNIASQRYYRWERYPSQRFSAMLGLSFVPF